MFAFDNLLHSAVQVAIAGKYFKSYINIEFNTRHISKQLVNYIILYVSNIVILLKWNYFLQDARKKIEHMSNVWMLCQYMCLYICVYI